ncbi:hypothetical protein BD324DRAFT_367527 [Kockovaella imperatae]|uniref:sn-1-specific diacylglycerol lipase n=1 Tax=Kockovaella imperatae TaxID=4999 RepID=A0A1Y1UM24_9TREE|nr:hypothetical protein BD324DRAFT_367527 [Kockovaella imperatae]ORX38577.1 hypothetical protein BD324DRAFT_367527 [Kockovaella imperatae]
MEREEEGPSRRLVRKTDISVDGVENNDDRPEGMALAESAGLRDLSVVPTLFPAQIANLITTLATSARLSLRLSAFFIEAILETSQMSTRLSLGYTRRLLVTAISSARRVYLMSNAAFDGDLLGVLGFGDDKAVSPTTTDTFLQVLDKYTNLGIYIIHHTFTLAELFAMSGFYLTANAVQSAHFAAQESVALFDSLFGSNESSRALSSIITLVRTELLEDERFKAKEKGKIASLTALTKALTAFACLQSATWKRTEAKLKTKVLYDCTVAENSVQRTHDRQTSPKLEVTRPNFSPASSSSSSGSAMEEVDRQLDVPVAEAKARIFEDDENARLLHAGGTIEITDEYSESTTVTHTFTVKDLEAMGVTIGNSHKRARSSPATSSPCPTGIKTIESAEDDDDEWVDFLRDAQLEGSGIPSVPNESSSTGTRAYRDTLEHSSASSERIQFVLKTMTSKLLSRKRNMRTEPGSNIQGSPAGRQHRPSVTSIAWSPQSTLPESSSSSIHTRSSESTPGTLLDSSSQAGAELATPVKRIMSRAKSAFRPLNSRKRVSRPSSPVDPEREVELSHRRRSEDFAHTRSLASPTDLPSSLPPSSSRNDPFNRLKGARDSKKVVKESVESVSNRTQTAVSSRTPRQASARDPGQVSLHDQLYRNLHRYMRFASAAYGQNFLRIFGMGDAEYNFPTTGQHHANSWSFAQHTKIPIDSLLLSSYAETTPLSSQKAPPLIHYVAVDHERKAVVLTCRGTLGLSDVLIDLTCDYCPIKVSGADTHGEYYVHSGMYQSALGLTARGSRVHQVLVQALEQNPTYGLVLTGHSLGGGVAALLAIACATPAAEYVASTSTQSSGHAEITTPFVTSAESGLPAGRPIQCYAFGTPAVASLDLAKWARGLIVSVVHGSDVVPTLSLGVLRDLKNVALTLFEEGLVAEEIVGRVIGVYQRKFAFQRDETGVVSLPASNDQALSDWTMSLIKTMRADMDNDKLYPPGNVYLIEYFDVCQTIHERSTDTSTGQSVSERKARRVILRHCESVQERFREPLFTKTMLNDHLPLHYERSTQLLADGLKNTK